MPGTIWNDVSIDTGKYIDAFPDVLALVTYQLPMIPSLKISKQLSIVQYGMIYQWIVKSTDVYVVVFLDVLDLGTNDDTHCLISSLK
jgi:hypothetical protein